MTPQSNFLIIARIKLEDRTKLEGLLTSMNRKVPDGTPDTGMADPDNPLVPFRQFGALHFARFVIIEDHTLDDFRCLGMEVPDYPITLAFLGDVDGGRDRFLADLVDNATAAAGLREVFACCEDFDPAETDLVAWMKRNCLTPAASYVNWIGRTVRQVRAEEKLRGALQGELASYARTHPGAGDDLRGVRRHLQRFADEQHRDLIFCPDPTPVGWWICNWLHYAIIPVLLLLPWALAVPFVLPLTFWGTYILVLFVPLSLIAFVWLLIRSRVTFAPLAALGLMFVALMLMWWPLLVAVSAIVLVAVAVYRWYEKSELEVARKPEDKRETPLANLEDHDVTNQFTVVGSIKPSAFRRGMFTLILWLTHYAARHIFNRGYLSRIRTIHAAHWTFLNDKRRVLFVSNYDGSRHAYMDDFINKTGWGLNVIFSCGVAYPRTRWLIKDGSKNEQRFKDTNRRHQIPTQVWYKAYPGLTAFDLARNTRVRKGLQRRWMFKSGIRAWLRDL